MASANLTKRTVDALEFTPGCDYFVWDTKLKGFGIRVTEHTDKAGHLRRRKVFILGYRPKGARQFKRLTLGVYGPVTTDQARDEALRQLSATTTGVDPVAERRAGRGGLTVKELGATYLEEVERRRKLGTAREYKRLWKKHIIPALGTKPVSAVLSADIRRLHRSDSVCRQSGGCQAHDVLRIRNCRGGDSFEGESSQRSRVLSGAWA